MRDRRLSDQVLVLKGITLVRAELATMVRKYGYTDHRLEADIMERLHNLYVCLDTKQLTDAIKQLDGRDSYGK